MADTENQMNENTTENMFESGGLNRNENIPLDEMLANLKGDASHPENPTKDNQTATPVEQTVKEELKQQLTPLEQMKLNKENETKGMVVSNEDLEAGKDKAPDKSIVYREDRMKNIHEEVLSFDETMKRREAIIIIKKPIQQNEYTQMMIEIDSVRFDENGKAYFDLKTEDGRPITPTYVRIREEGESINDFKTLDEEMMKAQNDIQQPVTSNYEDDGEVQKELSEEMKKTVQVIIDKTGYGTDFAFTEEERAKLVEAETIKINEVKVLDINAIRAKKTEKSFQDIIKENDYTGSRVSIYFPASGFKAQMKGMTYGEYADVALSMDNVTFDQYYKRLSIIYNKMTNISTGPFADFEDFLKNFAYTDIQLAVYALFVATEQEQQQIQLRCGRNDCHKTFDWKYGTRNILRLDQCAEEFLVRMKEIVTADAADYDKIRENAIVNKPTCIELPYSKYVVELGIVSAYDFLYNFIPLMDEDTLKETFGATASDAQLNNILLLTTVKSIMVPDGNDGYVECTGYKDILDAIYNISPEEIKIIAAYAAKFQSDYEMVFAFVDVVCPHCKNVTKQLAINVDDLVFQTYQRLMSTEIELPKFQNS